MNANAHLRPAMNALLSPPPTPATGGSASAQAMNEPLQKQRGVRFSAGAHDDDACAAVLLSIAECRTLRPVSVEVLPFLCAFAHRLRHTFDGCVDVAVDVDRACSAWTVDRDALEEALLEVVLGSVCAIRRRGRLTLRASVDDRSNQRSTVLTVFNKVPHEDCSTFSWRN